MKDNHGMEENILKWLIWYKYLIIMLYKKFLQCKTKQKLILIGKEEFGLFYKDIQVTNKHVAWFHLYKIPD